MGPLERGPFERKLEGCSLYRQYELFVTHVAINFYQPGVDVSFFSFFTINKLGYVYFSGASKKLMAVDFGY